tara:strand:+ start:2662 stop:2814 length:153 start_codon:yes stop_codon:yes gene_type:complete
MEGWLPSDEYRSEKIVPSSVAFDMEKNMFSKAIPTGAMNTGLWFDDRFSA